LGLFCQAETDPAYQALLFWYCFQSDESPEERWEKIQKTMRENANKSKTRLAMYPSEFNLMQKLGT